MNTVSEPRTSRSVWRRWWMRVLLALLLLSAVADIANTPDLLSRGAVSASLRFAVPIVLAGLGGLWAERCGVINIGLEGMMIIGTWMGAWAGFQWSPWVGVLAAIAGGAVFGAFHALMTVSFGVDQAVSGIAINVAALGLGRFLSSIFFEGQPGGGISQSPHVGQIANVSVPGLAEVLDPIAMLETPVISDIAEIAIGVTTGVSLLTLLAAALVFLSWWVLFRTSFGLRLRACGENPAAADSLGVNPNRMRYAALTVSGALAGLGGAFLVTVASSIYREGQVAGRGFIGLATVIFGNWMPGRLTIGALLFGFTDALRTRQETTMTALLIVGAVVFTFLTVRAIRARNRGATFAYAIAAVGLGWWFLGFGVVPSEFVGFAPHLTTLLVLSLAHQRIRPPQGIGVPYRRSEAN